MVIAENRKQISENFVQFMKHLEDVIGSRIFYINFCILYAANLNRLVLWCAEKLKSRSKFGKVVQNKVCSNMSYAFFWISSNPLWFFLILLVSIRDILFSASHLTCDVAYTLLKQFEVISVCIFHVTDIQNSKYDFTVFQETKHFKWL